jgi:hypothetical protein
MTNEILDRSRPSSAKGQITRQKPLSLCFWIHYARRVDRLNSIEGGKLNLRILDRSKISERSEEVARAGKRKRQERELAEGRDPGRVDWDSLDLNGEPMVSFSPGTPLCTELKRMLRDVPSGNPARRRIATKLGAQFARYYTRYRRQAEARSGRQTTYAMLDGERPAAEVCAVNLILRGVTPRELLEHWDANIKNFIGGLAIPPLSFLKSPAAVDQVVCKSMGKGQPARRNSKSVERSVSATPSRERLRSAGGNTFSDRGGLDHTLRSALTEAGFETNMLNDRYLLGIQYNAVSVARGDEVFLSSRNKSMVEWLAEHFVKQRGLV